jgi:hypothetical protein
MAKTAVMTLRIDPELLAELKARAKHLGRSVSSEVVFLIAQELGAVRSPMRVRPTMGMFREFEAPSLRDFSRARRTHAHRVQRSIQRRAKAR